MPRLWIFMPVYNGAKYVAETLESLRSQTFRDFRILVVDDGSTDATVSVVREAMRQDDRIELLRLQHNKGEVAARNLAVRRILAQDKTAEFLLNHDCDDISLPTKLEKQIAYLDAHPHTSILGTRAHYMADGVLRAGPNLDCSYPKIRASFAWHNSMVNSAAIIRRTVFEQLGGYDPAFRLADDYHFFARALRAGFIVENLRDELHIIRVHAQSISTTKRQAVDAMAQRVRDYYVSPA
jgi:glycosyltransferase involved in cell wall biosynthesis